jgi:Kef-type K+ transport system membrane component KefB
MVDSLIAVKLRNWLSELLGVEVVIFEILAGVISMRPSIMLIERMKESVVLKGLGAE